jgi:hypothetical protein
LLRTQETRAQEKGCKKSVTNKPEKLSYSPQWPEARLRAGAKNAAFRKANKKLDSVFPGRYAGVFAVMPSGFTA